MQETRVSGSSGSNQIDARRSLGRKGEEMAVEALRHKDLQVIDRNWRCAVGELDIIAQEKAPDFSQGGKLATWLVIVEVRTRRGYSYGSAKDAVDRRKQIKLREVATYYVQETGWQGPWRIDVVAVQMDGQGRLVSLDHIRNAVTDE